MVHVTIQDVADRNPHPRFRRLEASEVPPTHLTDPDGEGIYILDEPSEMGDNYRLPVLLMAAAMLDVYWRDVHSELVYFRPVKGEDRWFPAPTGRYPHGWRLNLPRAWRPVLYAYCTPRAGAQ